MRAESWQWAGLWSSTASVGGPHLVILSLTLLSFLSMPTFILESASSCWAILPLTARLHFALSGISTFLPRRSALNSPTRRCAPESDVRMVGALYLLYRLLPIVLVTQVAGSQQSLATGNYKLNSYLASRFVSHSAKLFIGYVPTKDRRCISLVVTLARIHELHSALHPQLHKLTQSKSSSYIANTQPFSCTHST